MCVCLWVLPQIQSAADRNHFGKKERNMGATLKRFLKVELKSNLHYLFKTCFVSSGWSVN